MFKCHKCREWVHFCWGDQCSNLGGNPIANPHQVDPKLNPHLFDNSPEKKDGVLTAAKKLLGWPTE